MPPRAGATRRAVRPIAAAVAILFGVATLVAGTRVLLGADPGYVVFRPLLVFNVAMGLAYLLTGIAIGRGLAWSGSAAGAIFLLNLLVLAGIFVLHRRGGAIAVESLRAMTLRTAVWLVLFLAVQRLGRARGSS